MRKWGLWPWIVVVAVAAGAGLLLWRKERQLDAALGLAAARGALAAELERLEALAIDAREQGWRELERLREEALWQEARQEVRRKHEGSQMTLRVLATGLGAYQIDYNFYPPTLTHLEPGYVPHVGAISADAWGNDIAYSVGERQATYLLEAPGQDGTRGTADDYRMQDGQMTYCTGVRGLKVEPLPLPGPDHPPATQGHPPASQGQP